ncbi:hypothetical protein ACPPVO_48990 [Dactylosporangium sp. McL0621]|uniref:hypothetical protein n=1 Tax=Dactylosporangium sp. McL0621 TaxID=3415678 RepID=UPI003CF0CA5C
MVSVAAWWWPWRLWSAVLLLVAAAYFIEAQRGLGGGATTPRCGGRYATRPSALFGYAAGSVRGAIAASVVAVMVAIGWGKPDPPRLDRSTARRVRAGVRRPSR